MLVAEILKSKGRNVFTVSPDETLSSAAALLYARKVGAMVVVDASGVVGMFSERDLVRAVAVDGPLALTRPIREFMSTDVVFARHGETIAVLLERMTDRRIRHLPVMSDGRLVGIVSIGDLVKAKIHVAEHEAHSLKAYIAAG